MSSLIVEMRKVDQITPYDKNARNNAKTVEALKRAIERFGFNQPIVIDSEGVVVKGHARLEAAKQLGMDEIPCIVSTADDRVNKADRVYDNMIHELTGWDNDGLGAEVRDVGDIMDEILGMSTVEYNISEIDVPVSGKDMDGVERARGESIKKSPEYIEAKCPDCGKTFYLEKGQIERFRKLAIERMG